MSPVRNAKLFSPRPTMPRRLGAITAVLPKCSSAISLGCSRRFIGLQPNELLGLEHAGCRSHRFALQNGLVIPRGCAFKKILTEKVFDSAEPLILRSVDKLVSNQCSIPPAIRT